MTSKTPSERARSQFVRGCEPVQAENFARSLRKKQMRENSVQVMSIFLILLCFYFSTAEKVSNDLTVLTPDGDAVPLDSYASHLEFFTNMQQLIGRKVKAVTESMIQDSKLKSDQLLSNIDANQYLYLQLLYSLALKDTTFTNQLLEQVAETSSSQKPILSKWVRLNIILPKETMYRVTETIAKTKKEGVLNIPYPVVEEMLLMINKSAIFHESCKRGDTEVVQWLIGTGLDFDLSKPLEAAWENERWNVVKILMQNRALKPIKVQDRFKNNINATLLHFASSGISPEAINALITAGAPVNVVDEGGASPLYLAITNNDYAAAEIFLKNGADVILKTNSGNTPLHAAVLNGNLEAVKLLLSLETSIHEKNNLGLTPLDIADQSGIFYILKHLLENGIRLPSVITTDQTILPYLFFFSEYGKLIHQNNTEKIENYCEITQLMNAMTSRVPYEKELKSTLLELVIKNKILFLTQCLINLGGDLTTTNRNGETLLFNAVRAGSYDITRLLLNEGVEVNAKNSNGTTALHLASAKCKVDIVGLLLKRGADINAVNKVGFTALHLAAKEGHLACVNYLLERKISIKQTRNSYDNNDQETPLQLAAANDHLTVVKNFLKKFIFDDSKKNETWSTIHAASKAGHTEVVKFLLDQGYRVNAADNHGKTPLWWAAFGGNVSTVMTLIERGADIHTTSNHESTGNRFAIIFKSKESPLHVAALNGHKEVCKLLIEKGLNKDARDAVGETPLYNAAERGHFDVVKFLVEKKVNKNTETINGTTALHAAAAEGHEEIVDFLIDKGMDIDIQDNTFVTPLYLAARAGRLFSVRHLIEKLADVNTMTAYLGSPLTAAVRAGHFEVALLLLDNGAKVDVYDNQGNSLLMDAVSRGYRDIVTLLLSRGAYLNEKSRRRDGKTALHIATAGDPDMVALLMEKAAWIGTEAADGTTPLFEAVDQRNEGAVKLLTERNLIHLDNVRKGDNWTCLHVAVNDGSLGIVKHLLDKSTKEINYQTSTKDTALHLAVFQGHYEITLLLLESGADVNIKNSDGKTAFDIASEENYTKILNLRLCNCTKSLL